MKPPLKILRVGMKVAGRWTVPAYILGAVSSASQRIASLNRTINQSISHVEAVEGHCVSSWATQQLRFRTDLNPARIRQQLGARCDTNYQFCELGVSANRYPQFLAAGPPGYQLFNCVPASKLPGQYPGYEQTAPFEISHAPQLITSGCGLDFVWSEAWPPPKNTHICILH